MSFDVQKKKRTGARCEVTAVGFEPTPLRTDALSQRLRPLGQTVISISQMHLYALAPNPLNQMEPPEIEPMAFRMQRGCDTSTPCARMSREDARSICSNPRLHTDQAQRDKPSPHLGVMSPTR